MESGGKEPEFILKGWLLESADSPEGKWIPWLHTKTLEAMPPGTLEECFEKLKSRQYKKAAVVHTQPLRVRRKTEFFVRARNIYSNEIIPLWAIDEFT